MHEDTTGFTDNTLKQKTINGFLWRFGEKISAQVVSFVISIVLARLLLPQEYGLIALTMVFINLADVFVTNGLGASLIQQKDVTETDYSTMLVAGLGITLLLYGLIFFSAPFVGNLYNNQAIVPILRIMALRLPLGIQFHSASYTLSNFAISPFLSCHFSCHIIIWALWHNGGI